MEENESVKRFSMNPADAVHFTVQSLDSRLKSSEVNPEYPPSKRIAVRKYPALLHQYLDQLRRLTPNQKLQEVHLAIMGAGRERFLDLGCISALTKMKYETTKNLSAFERSPLYDELLPSLTLPSLRDKTRRVDIPVVPYLAEEIDEWALTLSVPQTVVGRIMVLAGFAAGSNVIPEVIADMCDHEVDNFDRVISTEGNARLKSILLERRFRKAG